MLPTHCLLLSLHYFILQPNSEELERRVEELRKEYQEARQRARGLVSGTNTPNSGASPVPHSSPR